MTRHSTDPDHPRRSAHRRPTALRPRVAVPVGLALAAAGTAVALALTSVPASTGLPRPAEATRVSDPATGTTTAASPLPAPHQTASPAGSAGSVSATPACADPACATPPPPAAAGKRWKLAFSEEFSGTDYDRRKLTPCFDWNYGACTSSFNEGREHYQPSQVVVSGGTAKLIAAPLSPPLAADECRGGSCTYKAGLLSTARPRADNGSGYLYKFTYGYVEARLKFPATRGFFTAFWMLPANTGYSYRSEIDILELLGDDPTTMFMTYHYADRSKSFAANKGKFDNGSCAVKDYSRGFVRMGVDWQPGHIAWYIDGRKCAEFTDARQIESGPMQIILHLMVDNQWQRQWNVGLDNPRLVRQLEVDYLRVYQQVAR